MDFGQLLHTAQRNDQNKKEIRYYSTKFEPPKKEQRSKQLSSNIKRFLAKQKEEEKRKNEEAQKKKDELLALRAQDKKATRRVNIMRKRGKSANQSVIQDAVDNDNTAVTLAGPAQPDEDDYGYVSQEASAYYNKMMEKYSKMPDEPKFNLTKKKVNSNLSSTKDRVRAALEREREEALLPHKRKRKHKETEAQESESEKPEREEYKPPAMKPRTKLAPPPMNFADLLKIAEKKQFEPIIIEQKQKEDEKLFTKKQKKELEREREWRERKEGKLPAITLEKSTTNKIPKLNTSKSSSSTDKTKMASNVSSLKSASPGIKPGNLSASIIQKKAIPDNTRGPILNKLLTNSSSSGGSNSNNQTRNKALLSKPSNSSNINKLHSVNAKPDQMKKDIPSKLSSLNGKARELYEMKMKKRAAEQMQPRKMTENVQPKQFPPKELQRKQFRTDVNTGNKKSQIGRKRQIIDDDSEYDSEMDDFIDDGPEAEADYSKYISEIFGYDKRRYQNMADDDLDNMESTFAQQMKEECISKKIGIMEDLEDMKKEEEEKRRKMLMKKRRV